MIKYSMLWMINSSINLSCHLPVNEKWEVERGWKCGESHRVSDDIIWPSTSHSLMWRPFLVVLFFLCVCVFIITTVRQRGRGRKPKSTEGKRENGRWKKEDDGEWESKWWGKAKWKEKKGGQEREAGWAFDACDYVSSWSKYFKDLLWH